MPFVPTIGETVDINNGINLANIGLFNAVRAATGGTQYYEAPDLGIYNVALVNCYAYYAALIRIYGTVKGYAYDNVYIPEGIMAAHGINYSDVQANIEKFRGWINLFAHKIMQFRLPIGFEYLNRAVWMNSNVYKDSPLGNAQLYEFVQTGFYQLQEGISAHAYQYYYKKQVRSVDYNLWYLKLVPAPWADDGVNINGLTSSSSGATTTELIQFGEQLIAPLSKSQDINYISAGYERAFKSFAEVNPIAETFEIQPVYDESVLMQIENATFINDMINIGCTIAEDIGVNSGNLVSDLRYLKTSAVVPNMTIATSNQSAMNLFRKNSVEQTNAILPKEIMLNIHDKTQFEPEDVMEATRMITYDTDATMLEFNSSDEWYSIAPMNSKTVTAATLAQGYAWYQMQTYASQIMFAPVLTAFRFNDYTQPWAGISRFAIALKGSRFITLDIATLAAHRTVVAKDSEPNWFNMLQGIRDQEYLQEFALTLLSQWDWHPRWVKWMLADGFSGGAQSGTTLTCAPSLTYLGQCLDVATYAMIGSEQLKDLNRYDMTSQFNNAQIGSYAIR